MRRRLTLFFSVGKIFFFKRFVILLNGVSFPSVIKIFSSTDEYNLEVIYAGSEIRNVSLDSLQSNHFKPFNQAVNVLRTEDLSNAF